MMKKHQIKIHWIVYASDYKPGDKYWEIPFLKDAWNKACSLGKGARAYRQKDVRLKDGWHFEINEFYYEVV